MQNTPTNAAVLDTDDNLSAPRDMLPWADPYIARLLAKHRLQAALDDSLAFVSSHATVARPHVAFAR